MNEDKPVEDLDPALLAEIEAEFADLTREIERISTMPRSQAPQKGALLEALRASVRQRFENLGNRPEWRQRLDATIGTAVDRLLEDGLIENPDGSLAFQLSGDTLKEQGGPVLHGLVEGLAHMLEERFPPPKAPAPGAPPTPPLQAALGSLGQVLVGALKTAVQGVGNKAASEGGETGAEPSGLSVSVKTKMPDPNVPGSGFKSDFAIKGEQDVSATFVYDSREGRPPSEEEATPAPTGPSPTGSAVIKQLIEGVGQALRQALAPPPAPEGTVPAPPAQPAPNAGPLSGIGALLQQVLQRAFAPPAAAPPAATPAATGTAPPTATPAPTAPATPAPTDTATPTTAAAEPATPEVPPIVTELKQGDPPAPAPDGTTPAAPPPSIQFDVAAILKSLFGNLKPPGS